MRNSHAIGIASSLSLITAWALARPGTPTYGDYRFLDAVLLALYFLPFAGGIYRLGRVAGAELGFRSPALALPLGAAILALDALLLGALRLIGPAWSWLFFANALALQLAWFFPVEKLRMQRGKQELEWLAGLASLFLVAAIVAVALYPRSLQDVNVYHLQGPATWWEAGKFFLSSAHSKSLYASYWDLLHFYPLAFFSEAFGSGHISVLVAAQLAHAVLGFAGACLLGYAILAEAGIARAWSLAFLPALFLIETVTWTAWYAKNDWGAILWMLAGAHLLVRRDFARDVLRSGLAAGVFHGLAAGTKLPNLALLPCLALALAVCRERRAALFYVAGAAVALLPIFARNFALTGDPVFPLSFGPFRNLLESATHLQFAVALPPYAGLAELGIVGYAALILESLGRIVASEPALIGALAFSLCAFGGRGVCVPAPLKALGLAAVLEAVLVAVVSAKSVLMDTHSVRLLAPSFLLARIYVVAGLLAWAEPRLARVSKKIPAATAWAWLLLLPFVPWGAALDIVQAPNPGALARGVWQAGSCRAWLASTPAASVVSLSEDNLFLGVNSQETAAYLDPRSDAVLRAVAGPPQVLSALASLGFHYFLHVPVRPDSYFFYPYQRELDAWIEAQGLPWEFRGKDCAIFNLSELGQRGGG